MVPVRSFVSGQRAESWNWLEEAMGSCNGTGPWPGRKGAEARPSEASEAGPAPREILLFALRAICYFVFF